MGRSQRYGWRTLLVMIALAALSMTLFSGCSQPSGSDGNASKPAGGAVMITETDADQRVKVSPGQRLDVVLKANPSTGYTWTIASSPAFLTTEGEPVFESEAASGALGAGGKQTLEFSVTTSGKGTLSLNYVRPWETNSAPAKSFKVEIESE